MHTLQERYRSLAQEHLLQSKGELYVGRWVWAQWKAVRESKKGAVRRCREREREMERRLAKVGGCPQGGQNEGNEHVTVLIFWPPPGTRYPPP